MPFRMPFSRSNLNVRLIFSYLLILGVGGLVTSIVGSWIVSSTIMRQARRSVDRDLSMAKTLYGQQLQVLLHRLHLAVTTPSLERLLDEKDAAKARARLALLSSESSLDFAGLTDAQGRIRHATAERLQGEDGSAALSVVAAAMSGRPAAGTEIAPLRLLGADEPAQRRPDTSTEAGAEGRLALVAAVPLRTADGSVSGVLYAGVRLDRPGALADPIWELLFRGDRYEGRETGVVMLFQQNHQIALSTRSLTGEPTQSASLPASAHTATLGRGEGYLGRALLEGEPYISAYSPLRDPGGRIVGVLQVGVLERVYSSIRDRVILSFFGIATVGFIFILATTYYIIRSITQPIGQMVAATHNIAAGRFDQEVPAGLPGEVGLLAESFNTMLHSLRQMKADLEEWGRTLEEKVEHRTQELISMQARVAQSERLASLGMLAAGVAHEVNNPLGGILALTALTLEDMPREDPNRENLEEVIKQTARCRDIVKGLLEFSRESEITAEPVDLNKILQETLSLVARQAHFFNIIVTSRFHPGLPPVMADGSQLQQVFLNVIINAVQAMEEKGSLEITTRPCSENRFVEALISDSGPGIPPEKIDHIFDPFFTTKPSGQGTGLGLSIAYGIVRKHGGMITASGSLGQGTTFTIRIPAALSQQPA